MAVAAIAVAGRVLVSITSFSLSDQWARQLGASEWCVNSVLGWLLIEGALPWGSMAIRMRGKMGWITKHVRSGCRRIKVVSVRVQSLVCWKAVEGTVALISRGNPRVLSVQSLEAHHWTGSCVDCGAPERLEAEIAGDIDSEVCESFPSFSAYWCYVQARSTLFLWSRQMGASSPGMCSMSHCRVNIDLVYHRDVSSLLHLFSPFSIFTMRVFNASWHFVMSWHIFTPC